MCQPMHRNICIGKNFCEYPPIRRRYGIVFDYATTRDISPHNYTLVFPDRETTFTLRVHTVSPPGTKVGGIRNCFYLGFFLLRQIPLSIGYFLLPEIGVSIQQALHQVFRRGHMLGAVPLAPLHLPGHQSISVAGDITSGRSGPRYRHNYSRRC